MYLPRIDRFLVSWLTQRLPDCLRPLSRVVLYWLMWTLFFALDHLLFMALYIKPTGDHSRWAMLSAWSELAWHGLPMDLSMAAYLTVIPGLLTIAKLWTRGRWVRRARITYTVVMAYIVMAILWLDLILYQHWHFRIDATPLFYFLSSPKSALASADMSWWDAVLVFVFYNFTAFMIWGSMLWVEAHAPLSRLIDYNGHPHYDGPNDGRRTRWRATIITSVGVAALFIPIRGGFTVATMNPSRAYFSTDQLRNHGAVNPVFNLMYSLTHQSDFGRRYRFMDQQQARDIYAQALYLPAADNTPADSLPPLVAPGTRPDIVVVVLESFSSHLLPSAGGADVASKLDSVARGGLLLPNVYASSFRTDRALPAIFSSLPAQPSTSILKYIDKIEALPSWPQLLKRQGYSLSYYYGGDTNFTNMQAYLMHMGFDRVVSDRDFSLAQRASKWGAHDDVVFSRAAANLSNSTTGKHPKLTVIQTSSSHEPFEVPYRGKRFADNKQQRAFAYTDQAAADFLNALSKRPEWANTLVVLVPDHYGCWPQNIKSMPERHRIPLIFTGGALQRRGIEPKVANQTDLGATLLTALGIKTDSLPFSRNIFSPKTAPIAIVTEPELVAVITPDTTLTYQCDAQRTIEGSADLIPVAQSHLQLLYQYIHKLK